MPPIFPTRSLHHRDTDIGALHPRNLSHIRITAPRQARESWRTPQT